MKAKIASLQLFNSTRLVIAMLVIVFAFLQYELWLSEGGVLSLVNLSHEIKAKTNIVEKITRSNSVLTADIADLRHGSDATEERARSHLGMIENGETYYQFIS